MDFVFTSARIKVAEGVGFEPTVGFPTLDFESSALNRTQPPFPVARIVDVNLRRAIIRRDAELAKAKHHASFEPEPENRVHGNSMSPFSAAVWNRSTLHRSVGQTSVGGAIGCSLRLERLKNVTILGLPWVRFAPHVVCPQGRIPSILLLTVIDDF